MLNRYKWMGGWMVGWTEISGRPFSKSTCRANKSPCRANKYGTFRATLAPKIGHFSWEIYEQFMSSTSFETMSETGKCRARYWWHLIRVMTKGQGQWQWLRHFWHLRTATFLMICIPEPLVVIVLLTMNCDGKEGNFKLIFYDSQGRSCFFLRSHAFLHQV